MSIITIYNTFHATECRLNVDWSRADGEGLMPLTHFQYLRCRRILCGSHDCDCGGPLKDRGVQEVEIYQTQNSRTGEYGASVQRRLRTID